MQAHLSCEEGHTGAIDPGIIGSSCHALEVVLALLGGDVSTGQLAIVNVDLISRHCLLHLNQSICVHEKVFCTGTIMTDKVDFGYVDWLRYWQFAMFSGHWKHCGGNY